MQTETPLPEAAADNVFVITGTGGVGATNVALHVAAALAARRETCLVDLDLTWQGLADRAALAPGHRTWVEVGEDDEQLRLSALPVAGGFRLLAAPRSGVPSIELLQRAARLFSCVVLDAPWGDALDRAATVARRGALLIAPTPAGCSRARRIIDRYPHVAWASVLSRSAHGGTSTRAEMAKRLGRAVTLELPCTPMLRDAEERSTLLHPWTTRWRRRVAALARSLEVA